MAIGLEITVFDEDTVTKWVNGPIRWMGSKDKALKEIMPRLPRRRVFVDVFGGGGVVILNRVKSNLDVYNDIHRGLVSFYRCINDYERCRELCQLIEFSVHSRYEFDRLKIERETTDRVVLRAFAWYYTVQYSFSGKALNFGRSTSGTGRVANIRDTIPRLWEVHRRFNGVQIEELDFRKLINDYDSDQTVFYCDPPYLGCDYYGNESLFTEEDHKDLINLAQNCEGFFAISGYPNELYDSFQWDDRVEWWQTTHMVGTKNTGEVKGRVKEVLWIKEN